MVLIDGATETQQESGFLGAMKAPTAASLIAPLVFSLIQPKTFLLINAISSTAQKMKFSIKDFSRKLRIWSYLLKNS